MNAVSDGVAGLARGAGSGNFAGAPVRRIAASQSVVVITDCNAQAIRPRAAGTPEGVSRGAANSIPLQSVGEAHEILDRTVLPAKPYVRK